MKIKNNVSLKTYTSIGIGGIAKEMYFPESIDDLMYLYMEEKIQYLIGGGTNLLINDKKVFDSVISLTQFNTNIKALADGRYYVGAGARIQTLINFSNKMGYGGLERLIAIPGLIGGAITMNAGLGKKGNICISDFIESVDVLENGKVITYKKEDCNFSYRNSNFKNKNIVVLSAIFKLNKGDREQFASEINKRLREVKEIQDRSGKNFGSVFSRCSRLAMELLKTIHYHHGEASFSAKRFNWILNNCDASFDDVMHLINTATSLNRLCRVNPHLEVIIWK